ncbi:Placenta growth factor-like [Homarus americanus]|uniref:Placenta growth factor-like n=1 Tax=Homarus americanus TaxID=6706 RepID=A0A8J5JRI0_HOMAM|nr:Placenta growth factor-like [Homarus americanus]
MVMVVDSMTIDSKDKTTGNDIEDVTVGVERGLPADDVGQTWSVREVHVSPKDARSAKSVEERAINRQMKQVKKLKCKPYRKKVYVRDKVQDERNDEELFPHVVVVKRCDNSCSFCGDSKGRELLNCVAIKTKMKKFTIYYEDEQKQRHYSELYLKQDMKCGCFAGADAHTGQHT